MSSDTPPNRKPFTIFRTAAEEAEMKGEEEKWHDEGGPRKSTANLVTHVPGAGLPYRVILARPRGGALERSFATMQEAEAFIRRHGPVPAPGLSNLYDRPAP